MRSGLCRDSLRLTPPGRAIKNDRVGPYRMRVLRGLQLCSGGRNPGAIYSERLLFRAGDRYPVRAIDGPSSRYAMPGRCRWAMPGHRTSWSTPPQSNGWGDGTRQSLKKQSLKKPLLTKQSLNKTQRGGLVRREGSCRRIRDKAVGAERDRLTPGGVIGRESRARHQPLIPKVCWRITSRAGLLAHRACGEDEPKSVDRSHECISRALHPPPCAFPCRSNDLHSDARLRGMRAHRPVYSCGYSPSFDSPDAAEPMCRKHIGAQR